MAVEWTQGSGNRSINVEENVQRHRGLQGQDLRREISSVTFPGKGEDRVYGGEGRALHVNGGIYRTGRALWGTTWITALRTFGVCRKVT